MANKQLADWIKAEETKGYSEAQLESYLLQKGYSKEDIQEAIRPTLSETFSLKIYMKSLSVPLWASFILAFAFIAYATDNLSEGVVLLMVIGLSAVVGDLRHRMQKSRLARWVTGAILFVILLLAFYIGFYGLIALALVIPHTLAYFFRSKKHPLESVFLSFFISMTYAVAIALAAYLIFAFWILALIDQVPTHIIDVMLVPVFTIFMVSYLLISVNMLKRTLGRFDYDAYFKSRHFPFTILNILTPKDGNTKNAIIRSTVIATMTILILSQTIMLIVGVLMVDQTYSKIVDSQKTLFGDYLKSDERYVELIKINGFDDIRRYPVREMDGKTVYSEARLENISRMHFDCDMLLHCTAKPFDQRRRIDEQVSLDGIRTFITAQNDSHKMLFILPTETEEQVISHHIFEFHDAGIKGTIVASEINAEWQALLREVISKRVSMPDSIQKKISLYYTGQMVDVMIDQVRFILEFGAVRSYITLGKDAIVPEYKWIMANNTFFYDQSTSLQEHMQNLRYNIDMMHPKLSGLRDHAPAKIPIAMHGSLLSKAGEHIYEHSDIGMEVDSVSADFIGFRAEWDLDRINKELDTVGNYQSDIDKALKLKIIETQIANLLISDCRTDDCMLEILSLVKNPYLCKRMDHMTKDRCIMDYSMYDKNACSLIRDENLKEECYGLSTMGSI